MTHALPTRRFSDLSSSSIWRDRKAVRSSLFEYDGTASAPPAHIEGPERFEPADLLEIGRVAIDRPRVLVEIALGAFGCPGAHEVILQMFVVIVVAGVAGGGMRAVGHLDDRSEEHTSELPSLMRSSYSVFFLKK